MDYGSARLADAEGLTNIDFRTANIYEPDLAPESYDISYSRFVAGLKAADIEVDRKILADIAVFDAEAFTALVVSAKAALA